MTAPTMGPRPPERRTAYSLIRRRVGRVLRRVGLRKPAAQPPSALRDGLRIRPGRMMPPSGGRLPLLVIVAFDLDRQACVSLCHRVERAQVLTGSFRPLFVTDSPFLTVFRAFGFAVERIQPQAAYEACEPPDSYSDYVLTRVTEVVRNYGARAVVPLPRGGIDDLDDLTLLLIGALPTVR